MGIYMNKKSVVGDLINFRGLVYSPMNENGVIFLFGKVMEDLNMYIEEIKPGFPDCIGRRFNGKGWEKVRIEFEYLSSNFKLHKHNPRYCDMIICWENDWPECTLEVIELKDFIKGLANKKISRPTDDVEIENESVLIDETESDNLELEDIEERDFSKYDLLEKFDEKVKGINDEIWSKHIKSGLSFYSPERVFMYAIPLKDRVSLWVFVGKGEIPGVDKRFKTKTQWGIAEIKTENDIKKIIDSIKISHKNIKSAIKKNEPINT